jgi:NADPH:quinone reductase-like Zn-dependent oxidoreductase
VNPTDYKVRDRLYWPCDSCNSTNCRGALAQQNADLAAAGSMCGCDFAGVVENDASGWTRGDRIAGFVHGNKDQNVGSFAGMHSTIMVVQLN